jgi:hypothetical protein
MQNLSQIPDEFRMRDQVQELDFLGIYFLSDSFS